MSCVRGRLASRAFLAASVVWLLAVPGSPTAAQLCIGDCDGDGEVTVDEILRGVNMALGVVPFTGCEIFDRGGNGEVEIDEVITAIDFALRGCPAASTPTSTSTVSPEPTPTPSATASPDPTPTPTYTRRPASPTAKRSATPTRTYTPDPSPGCGSSRPPASFGEAFVDLTTGVEADLVPIAPPAQNAQPTNSVAFFNDVDGDGIMEVFVGQDAWPIAYPVMQLRYDASTGNLARNTAAVLPSFTWFYGVFDVDSDGIADLFGDRDGRPRVAWGLGGGAFAEPADVFPEPGRSLFYVSPYFDDFDGDGWLDLVVDAGAACGSSERGVQVLFADGNRHWSRRNDLVPTDLRVGAGLVFTAPLAGVNQTAVVLGQECVLPEQPEPRFFVPSGLEETGLPIWTPSRVVIPRGSSAYPFDPISEPMGAAVADLDGDGSFELSITGDVAAVWQGFQAPMRQVTDLTNMGTKIGDNGVPLIPWSVLFIDLDRDGRLDTFVTHGDDYMAQEYRHVGKQWSTAYWNTGGLCGYEISESLNITRRGDWRTLAVGDLEGDGLPDLAVGGHGEQPRILHNRIDTGNQGFGLRLQGTTSNRYGIGARIDVTVAADTPVQHHLVGGFYPVATVVEPLVFVGLGKASTAKSVRITWPSGTVQELNDVAAGALHTIEEPPAMTVDPVGRHLAAGSDAVATVHVTPRDLDGGVRADAAVEVAVVTGAATLKAPAAWNGSEWLAQVLSPTLAGSSVIEVKIDGKPLGVRPRIWFD